MRELILAPRGSVDGFVGRLLDITTWGTVLIIHFITTSYFGWPKLTCKIYKLDETDTIDLVSYGTLNLPVTPGFHECSCDTWSLHGNRKQETFSYFLDSKPIMSNNEPITKKPNFREYLVTKPGPRIHVNVEVMLKNFKNNQYSLAKN